MWNSSYLIFCILRLYFMRISMFTTRFGVYPLRLRADGAVPYSIPDSLGDTPKIIDLFLTSNPSVYPIKLFLFIGLLRSQS